MSGLINKLSHLMSKMRFDELQNISRQICYYYFEVDGDFSQIYEGVGDAIAETDSEYKEQEKMLLHFLIYRNIELYNNGEELTDLKWGSYGFMETAEIEDVIQ